MTMPGLEEIARAYAEHGWQRTGSPGAARTADWLHGMLREMGAGVERLPFGYSHYHSAVTDAAGRALDAELLYYSWTGTCGVRQPLRGSVGAQGSEHGILQQLDALAAQAAAGGYDGVIAETRSAAGGLCGVNRAKLPEYDLPLILAAPGAITAASFPLTCTASAEPREAVNILARFQSHSIGRPVVVTTPLTGWFTCAGERGTGVALALALAEHLAALRPVDLVLTQAHELGYLGGYEFARSYQGLPAAVLHLGSCLANRDSEIEVKCAAPGPQRAEILHALRPLGAGDTSPADPAAEAGWQGESKCWASDRYPILSVAGQSPLFHTPHDLPAAAFTGADLRTAGQALGAAGRALLQAL